MSEFSRVALIGDAEYVYGFRVLGVKTFSPGDAGEARKIAAEILKGGFALCLVDQRWLTVFKEEEEEAERKLCPVIVGFSDYRSLTDELAKRVRAMAVKATGSDSIVKRKG